MRVLISGAGIAGPALAWFVARTGAQVTIVEKNFSALAHGQNIDLQGSAITVVKKMGVLEEIKKRNTTEKGTQLIDRSGKPFAFFPVVDGSSWSPSSNLEILRGDLSTVLYEATKDHPNVSYLFDTTITKVITNNDEVVRVQLSSGEIQEYDLLVAADGQWSKVRRQCFPAESVKVVDKNMYVAYFTVPRQEGDNNWWNVYLSGDSRTVAIRPDPHGTVRAMFSCMPNTAAEKKTWEEISRKEKKEQQQLVRREFSDAGWQSQRLVDAMEQSADFYLQGIKQIRMDKWYTSRVVCLGDAGYCPTPLTGQGTALAIIGAYILAGEIGKLQEGENPTKALEAYDHVFRPHVEKIQEIPPFIPGILHPKGLVKLWLLQSIFWVVSKVIATIVRTPWLAKRFDSDSELNDDGFTLPEYSTLDEKCAA